MAKKTEEKRQDVGDLGTEVRSKIYLEILDKGLPILREYGINLLMRVADSQDGRCGCKGDCGCKTVCDGCHSKCVMSPVTDVGRPVD